MTGETPAKAAKRSRAGKGRRLGEPFAGRLDFLRGLEVLLFDPLSREALLERRQLHMILERETWVLGEQYHLTASDRSLTEVLDRHLGLLRPGG